MSFPPPAPGVRNQVRIRVQFVVRARVRARQRARVRVSVRIGVRVKGYPLFRCEFFGCALSPRICGTLWTSLVA
jgi:hypothetical protein